MTPPGIPVIDVGALRDGGDAGEVATALHRASNGWENDWPCSQKKRR